MKRCRWIYTGRMPWHEKVAVISKTLSNIKEQVWSLKLLGNHTGDFVQNFDLDIFISIFFIVHHHAVQPNISWKAIIYPNQISLYFIKIKSWKINIVAHVNMFSELQQLEGAGRHNETEDDGEVWLQLIKNKLENFFLKLEF